MLRAQAARPNRGAVVRFLMLLVVFGSIAALLVWLKLAPANTPELSLPTQLQDFLTLPEELAGRVYYEPKESGAEAEIKERLDRWRREREER